MRISRKELMKHVEDKTLVLKEKNFSYEIIVKSIPKIRFFCKIHKLSCELISNKKRDINSLEDLANAINIRNKKERIEFIYDRVCDYLDSDFLGQNKCEFLKNQCLADRAKPYYKDCGCCRAKSGELCDYLKDGKCTIRNLGCKFFICPTLKKKGLKYKINDFYLLKYFCNFREKIVLRYTIFVPKEKVIERVLSHRW